MKKSRRSQRSPTTPATPKLCTLSPLDLHTSSMILRLLVPTDATGSRLAIRQEVLGKDESSPTMEPLSFGRVRPRNVT